VNGTPAAPPPKPAVAWHLLLVCLAASVPYLASIDNYYVRDDFGVVQLLASKPWNYFPQWFTSSWMDTIWGYLPDEVRPFPAVSYQLTAWLAPGHPEPDHIVNIGLHVANALLVFALARSAGRLAPWPSTIAAVLFALLPNQAETVAWITGRVDSMPAFFYLASVLTYVYWRTGARGGSFWLVLSLLSCFMGLFTKQNVITLIGSLVLYDVMLAPGAPWLTVKTMAGWIPFAALTAGYLWLRDELFGAVARGGRLTQGQIDTFAERAVIHWNRVAFGSETPPDLWPWLLLGGGAIVAVFAVIKLDAPTRMGALLTLAYFGPLWWAVGMAPNFVAGYVSPRHAYLASVAWAIALGITVQVVLDAYRGRRARIVIATATGLLLATYAVQTRAQVANWEWMADISERSVESLEERTAQLPDGSLVIVDVPWNSWEWGLPFAARPPFTSTDLTRRLFIVWPRGIDCCQGLHWRDQTQRTVQAWAEQPSPGPVMGMYVDFENGTMSVLNDTDDPALNDFVRLLIPLQHPDDLDRTVTAITTRMVAGHAEP